MSNEGPCGAKLLPVAASARGDRGTVRARSRVPKEGADLFGDLGTQGVLDSASVLVHHVVVDSESVMKQPLSQPVTTDDFLGARLPEAGQKELAGFETDEALPCHPKEGSAVRQEFRHVLSANHRFSGVFLGMPERLQQVVNQFLLDCLKS